MKIFEILYYIAPLRIRSRFTCTPPRSQQPSRFNILSVGTGQLGLILIALILILMIIIIQ